MDTKQIRALRKTMTVPELILWKALRGRSLGVKFRRQAPIGCYIADFVCLERRLIIEVDGSQHLDSEHDRRRDSWLASQGYTVLRFWNGEIRSNLSVVLDAIAQQLDCLPVHKRTFRTGRRNDCFCMDAYHPLLASSPLQGEETMA